MSSVINIDEVVDSIELWLKNGLSPDDLNEMEQNIMTQWRGEAWREKWSEANWSDVRTSTNDTSNLESECFKNTLEQ